MSTASELPGLSRACGVLADGGAVVVPNPAPMTYGLVATSPTVVNATKRRPVQQSVGVSLHSPSEWERVTPGIDLPSTCLDAVLALLRLRLTLLLPFGDGAGPRWVAPAVQDGYLAAFNGYWTLTATLWETFPRLYGSSANVTGEPPAGSAREATRMFGPDVPVVDADAVRGDQTTRRASTMLRIDRDRGLHLHRAGAQDADHAQPEAFLRHLVTTRDLPFHVGAVR